MHYAMMRTIAIDDPGRLSGCTSRGFAVHTWINRSCLGWRLLETQVVLDGSSDFIHGFDAAFAKLLWSVVFFSKFGYLIIEPSR